MRAKNKIVDSGERRIFGFPAEPVMTLGALFAGTLFVSHLTSPSELTTLSVDCAANPSDSATWVYPEGDFDGSVSIQVDGQEFSLPVERTGDAVYINEQLMRAGYLGEVIVSFGGADVMAGTPTWLEHDKWLPGDQAISVVC